MPGETDGRPYVPIQCGSRRQPAACRRLLTSQNVRSWHQASVSDIQDRGLIVRGFGVRLPGGAGALAAFAFIQSRKKTEPGPLSPKRQRGRPNDTDRRSADRWWPLPTVKPPVVDYARTHLA